MQSRTPLVGRLLVALCVGATVPAFAEQGLSTGEPRPPAAIAAETVRSTSTAVVETVVSRDETGHLTVRASRVPEAIVIDGRLDDPIYARLAPIADFVQQEPAEGQPATEKTEVWIVFDDRQIYVSARCWDSHPERMVANDMRRDGQNIFQNENFGVVFDTFGDRRNGMQFHTNPLGGLADSLVTDEVNSNRDWNTLWEVRTGRFDQGWTVEMAIPFASLRYPSGKAQRWGVNFRRIVRWKNETSYLTSVPASAGPRGLMKVSVAATLTGLEGPTAGKNLEIKPYVISGIETNRSATPAVENDWQHNVGFDVKYGLTRGLVADFTVNTDFAQVEEDEQQVNLTRFSLFFPEKREFFLEGMGIFGFGGVNSDNRGMGPPSDAPILFFSRRIGLQNSVTVPLQAGARVTGRAGAFSIGALNINTGESAAALAEATNFSVVRMKRDILRRSNIGFIATHRTRSVESTGSSSVVGVDANFAFFTNLDINSSYARSHTPGYEGRDASYRGRLEYNGDRYGVEVERLAVQENFLADVGFIRRPGITKSAGQLRFSPRPKRLKSVRKFTFETSLDYFENAAGALETQEAQGRFRTEFSNGDNFNLNYERVTEVLDTPFEIADGIVLPVGSYPFQSIRASYQLGPQRRLNGWFNAARGTFYNGDRSEVGYNARIELSSRIIVEPRLQVNWVDLDQGRFVSKLVGGRFNFMMSPRMLFASLVQFNSATDSVSANVRFRWEYRPGSDFFVVYSEGRNTTLGRGFPALDTRSFVVKLTRLVRF